MLVRYSDSYFLFDSYRNIEILSEVPTSDGLTVHSVHIHFKVIATRSWLAVTQK
jgi:hypothetical protein